MQASVTYLSELSATSVKRQAALRLQAPQSSDRTATHFILLLDISDSMNHNGKLEHVKTCASLLLRLMTPADYISVIAFGQDSQIIMSAVQTYAVHLRGIGSVIQGLAADGCTNLSAGLASVQKLLSDVTTGAKPTLLLLTDGHANRGVVDASSLQTMISKLVEQFPALSMFVVGYGTDHHAGLLKAFAELTHGSYSIVENQEDAAGVLGDALGGALSCTAQNVHVKCPEGTVVSGPYTVKDGAIRIGDLYSGTDTLLLLELPEGPVTVCGTQVPELTSFDVVATPSVTLERNPDIELTRMRYQCSDLFRQVRGWAELDSGGQAALLASIDAFRLRLDDALLADHPVTQMLHTEAQSLLQALRVMQQPGRHYDMAARILQHEAYTSLGRGTSSAIAGPEDTQEDPEVMHLHAQVPAQLQSPMSTVRQRQMATLMRTMSQQPEL
jgi:Mg-chelatase subunit ChlD